jgi:hypothetical protein
MRIIVFWKVMPCIIADHMDVSLKMEAAGSFETPGLISHTGSHHKAGDSHF